MNIKNELLDLILSTPRHFAAVYLLINNKDVVEVKPYALQKQLERRYKTAKQNIAIVDYLRKEGFKDVEIFEY